MSPTSAGSRSSRVEQQIRSGTRLMFILAALAVALPLASIGLIERQARRLEALGDHGAITVGTVTKRDRSVTYYEYQVAGATYAWNVRTSEADHAPGETFPILYLPEDPSLTRPHVDHANVAREASENRRSAAKFAFGIFYFFGAFTIYTWLQIRRFRTYGDAEFTDPEAPKRRLRTLGVIASPILLGIFAAHFVDARARGESTAPVFVAMAVVVVVLFGVSYQLLSRGPAGNADIQARSKRMLKWTVPAFIAITVLRVVLEVISR